MDARAITRKGEDLTKASNASEPASVLLPMLAELRDGVKASEDILRSTKIGIIVNKLRSSKDSAVAREAQDLVTKWRNDVKGSKSGSGSQPTAKAAALDAQKRAKEATPVPSSSAPAEVKKEVKKEAKKEAEDWKSTAPEKRNLVTDKVKGDQHSDKNRNACFRLMYDGLSFMSSHPPSRIQPIAYDVEACAWKKFCPRDDPTAEYKQKMRSLFQNLKSKTSRHLSEGLLADPPKIIPSKFITMTAEELKSEERKAEDEKFRLENIHDASVPEKVEAVSKNIQCGKCKEWKVRYSTAQTRSADEPMTQFCTCTVCGNNWKM